MTVSIRTRFVLLLVMQCWAIPAFSDLVEEQALSFGSFVITGNDAESTLIISKNGSDPLPSYKIYPLISGQPGKYRLTNLPPYTPPVITINNFQLTLLNSQSLLIRDITFDAILTNENGEALLTIGATLKTNGNSAIYQDGSYSGDMNILISY